VRRIPKAIQNHVEPEARKLQGKKKQLRRRGSKVQIRQFAVKTLLKMRTRLEPDQVTGDWGGGDKFEDEERAIPGGRGGQT